MLKEKKIGVFTYKNEDYDFEFKASLSAYDKMLFVKTVVDTIVNVDSYDSIIRDLIFDFAIIEVFTNIDTSFIEMKDENGEDVNPIILIEHFLEESNVVNVVRENVNGYLFEELNRAIDLNVQYLTGICPNPLNETLGNLLSTLDKKIDGIDLESMMNMAKKFSEMTDDFTMDNLVNAYMNSDIHQKNLLEIKEAKDK